MTRSESDADDPGAEKLSRAETKKRKREEKGLPPKPTAAAEPVAKRQKPTPNPVTDVATLPVQIGQVR